MNQFLYQKSRIKLVQYIATLCISALLPFVSLWNQGYTLPESFNIFVQHPYFLSSIYFPFFLTALLGYFSEYEYVIQPYPIVLSNTVKFALGILTINVFLSSWLSQKTANAQGFPFLVTEYIVISSFIMTVSVFLIRQMGMYFKGKIKGPRNVLLVTYPTYKTYLVKEIQSASEYKVAHIHDSPSYHKENLSSDNFGFEEEEETLLELCKKYQISVVVLDTSYMRSEKLLNEIYQCRQNNIFVEELPHFLERVFRRIPLLHIESGDKIINSEMQVEQKNLPLVRSFNTAVSFTALFVYLCCIFPFIVIGMLITMPGPVFFIQKRVGLFDKVFNIYKIRTMKTEQKVFKKEDLAWAQKNDPRIPFLGKILRALKLDEFPQFFNVIKGEMNIVGPRPQMLTMIDKYEAIIPYYSRRHLVRPGLTGWAQINHTALSSTEDVVIGLQYDLYYVKHRSLVFDVYIILMTVSHLIKVSLKLNKKEEN